MVQGGFELSNNSSIRIKGKSFDLNAFKDLNDILQKLTHKNKTKNISLIILIQSLFLDLELITGR